MMALTESEFSVLKKFAAAGDWKKIQRVSPYFITRLEAASYLEVNSLRSHARITKTGRAAHREAHIMRGKSEPIPCTVEEIARFGRMK
jgi:hypothetical protein